jgi:hypothetical protein
VSFDEAAILAEIAVLLPFCYCAAKAVVDFRARRYVLGTWGVIAALIVACLEAGLVSFVGQLSLK